MTEEEAKAKLKELYDGYHFNEDCVDIYNPFSILNTFAKKRFGDYWFETGTPTFLVELMKGCGCYGGLAERTGNFQEEPRADFVSERVSDNQGL